MKTILPRFVYKNFEEAVSYNLELFVVVTASEGQKTSLCLDLFRQVDVLKLRFWDTKFEHLQRFAPASGKVSSNQRNVKELTTCDPNSSCSNPRVLTVIKNTPARHSLPLAWALGFESLDSAILRAGILGLGIVRLGILGTGILGAGILGTGIRGFETSAMAEQPPCAFPWTCSGAPESPNRLSATPYQILTQASPEAKEPVHKLKPKTAYAYGWYGSNPQPIWGRHFGYSRNYTQWTRR